MFDNGIVKSSDPSERRHIMDRTYIAIDLKSFYASVECVERGFDPLTTNLVVADPTRTDKTICLAVSPSLKKFGIPGRARLFEVRQQVKMINAMRRTHAPGRTFSGSSQFEAELQNDPSLELDFVVAPPRMSLYMDYSTRIYRTYLKYIAPEDIHVYSCDEVFMDVTAYLDTYHMTAHELTYRMIKDVLKLTGITATAGIGTNLFLCKIAMDIVAKHIEADADGVRIAELDEMKFRQKLWNHQPITDFWRIGSGIARRLYSMGLYTMGDVAAYSEKYEDNLYKEFGVNAELIIDHAWGWEPCTIEAIKQYRPENNSLSTGQVLKRPYSYEETAIIVREMTELLTLDLVRKGLVTDQMTLTLGYESLKKDEDYDGEKGEDRYGRVTPRHSHGTVNLEFQTSSTRLISEAVMGLYERIVNKDLCVRRLSVCACRVIREQDIEVRDTYEQLDLFTDYEAERQKSEHEKEVLAKERSLQLATLKLKDKFGKNAVLKGTDLLEGATTIERNGQVGGHRA